jgi:hypothetical protein
MKPLRAALLTLLLALLAAPASALAAPASDDFAEREVLPSGFPMGLPVEATGSNVEATKEDGEPAWPLLSPAEHSIWFEWEATANGWVSVGTCGTQFPTLFNVFTGTEIDKLTSVLKFNGSEGPDCPGENQIKYTFKATSGTKYVIVVDGNDYTGPEVVPVQTEGEIFLQIEETQPPANDDFADAEPLVGDIDEEPGGNRNYFAIARGNNWTATTEPEEPSYGAGTGASVWYEWTVPVGATYSIGACCGPPHVWEWGLYSGDSLSGLTELFKGAGSTQMTLAPGTNLKMVVFGSPDSGTEEPTMGSFSFLVQANLPPLPKPPPGGGGSPSTPVPPDITPPQTTITKSRLAAMTRSAKFWFSSSESASGFLCKLDKGPFKACGSPRNYRKLKPGRHTFKVKAIDAAGNVDATPAITRISLPERRPRR